MNFRFVFSMMCSCMHMCCKNNIPTTLEEKRDMLDMMNMGGEL